MKSFLERFKGVEEQDISADKFSEEQQLIRKVKALFGLISNIYGSDRLVLKAGKLEALELMKSENIVDQVIALQRLVFDDPTIEGPLELSEIKDVLDSVEEEIADLVARRSVEDQIENKINQKIQEKHEEYVKEVKMQVLKDQAGPENPQTQEKLAKLEGLEAKGLSKSAMELLRPKSLDEIVGQERAVRSLMSKLVTPFPQHVLLYGPPGVGKTTAARLALEEARKIDTAVFEEDAPFIEVDGSTLRWDPREVSNPLLGSVHDPIYQGARRELADTGIPEPKLGLVTDAHCGILFIDEIGELDSILQNKLLKVLEDKKVEFESSYYDSTDPNVPQWIKRVFENGAPADFVLIGATTKEPDHINPAIRSRCTEVFFEPLTPDDIVKIVDNASSKLDVKVAADVSKIISQYTIEGRKAINILADVYGLVLYKANKEGKDKANITITAQHVYEIIQTSRLSPYVHVKAQNTGEVGRILGLGVSGYLGSIIEIEAAAFEAKKAGEGTLRFNDTAGSMAKDSVFNAASVIRSVLNKDVNNYDIHVNIVGGGNIDGPSAGVAITLAIISAIENTHVRQDIAVTGEISIQGRIKPVGGIVEKIYGAKQAGVKTVFIPEDNRKDVPVDIEGIKVIFVKNIKEIIPKAFR